MSGGAASPAGAARPWWLTVLVWVAGTVMILLPLALVTTAVLWPAVFLRAACFAVVPAFLAMFALGAILMKPVPAKEGAGGGDGAAGSGESREFSGDGGG